MPAVREYRGETNHPAPRPEASFLFQFFRFFSPRTTVRGKTELGHNLPDFFVIISLVQAQSLRLLRSGLRAIALQTFQRWPHQLHVMPIGAVH